MKIMFFLFFIQKKYCNLSHKGKHNLPIYTFHQCISCREIIVSHLLDEYNVIAVNYLTNTILRLPSKKHDMGILWVSLTLVMMSSRVALDAFESPKDLMLNAPIRNEFPMWTDTRSRLKVVLIFMLYFEMKMKTCIYFPGKYSDMH